MPVLNRFTLINQHFDDYKLMDHHNDFAGMVEEIDFDRKQPHYYFLNVGETHYPYMLDGKDLPHISGVHGVFKSLGKEKNGREKKVYEFFETAQMEMLHKQQVKCVEYIDNLIGELVKKATDNTYFIVTSDHGELW